MATMLILFGVVLVLVLINVPIAVALGIVATAAMVITQGTESLPNLPIIAFNGATKFPPSCHSAIHSGRRHYEFIRHLAASY